MACRAERQQKAEPAPRYARPAVHGFRQAAHRVTTVASICRAGMLRQHTPARLSQANSFWERPMQFRNKLADDRPQPRSVSHKEQGKASSACSWAEAGAGFAARSAASGPCVLPYRQIIHRPLAPAPLDGGDRAPGRPQRHHAIFWRTVPATVVVLMMKAVGGVAACGDIVFPRLLVAVMSWTIAQALAGCLAYVEAMYPCFVEHEPFRDHDGASRASGTAESSPVAPRGIGANGAVSRLILSGDRNSRGDGISRGDLAYFARLGDYGE
jgi:hypothetical protein